MSASYPLRTFTIRWEMITLIRVFLRLIFLGTATEVLLERSWENWLMRRIQHPLHNTVLAGLGRSGQNALVEIWKHGYKLPKRGARERAPQSLR